MSQQDLQRLSQRFRQASRPPDPTLLIQAAQTAAQAAHSTSRGAARRTTVSVSGDPRGARIRISGPGAGDVAEAVLSKLHEDQLPLLRARLSDEMYRRLV